MKFDKVKSFTIRTVVSAALAGLVYAGDHVVDLGTSADNAALIAFGISYLGHFVHALSVKYGVDPTVSS